MLTVAHFQVISIASALGAAHWGMHDPAAVAFCGSKAGWVFMLVAINLTPVLAQWGARQSQGLGLVMLAFDGALSGLALCPLLSMAHHKAPGSIEMAAILTGTAFAMVSLCVLLSPREIFPVRGSFLSSAGLVLIVGILLNGLLFHLAALHLMLCVAVGVYGVVMLVYTTNELRGKRVDNGVEGALLLFASLFNIFVSILNILVSTRSKSDD